MTAQLLGVVLFWIGLGLTVAGVIGVLRLPDTYARIKAMASINGLAAFFVHVSGALVLPSEYGFRSVLIAVLFLLSGPALAQVIARCAHRLEVPAHLERDDLAAAPGSPPSQVPRTSER